MGIDLNLRSKQLILLVASAVIYSLMFNWKFSLILVVSLAVHEMGHAWAIKRHGLEVGRIYFIPIFGASTNIKGKSPFDLPFEQRFPIAIMGLVWSLILAVAAAIAYRITGVPFYAGAASLGAVLICLNIIPLNLTDGGKILIPIALSHAKRETFAALSLTCVLVIQLMWENGFVFPLLLGLWGIHDFDSELKKGTAAPVPKELAIKYTASCLAILAITLGLLVYVSGDWLKYLVS